MKDALARDRSGYIPTLDGWRAIAIMGVVCYHIRPVVVDGFSFGRVQQIGRFGVQLFFVISGILICTRLLEEEKVRGRISFRSFYIRRFFRIQPAAFLYLGTIALISICGLIPFNREGLWMSLLSLRNFYNWTVSNNGAVYTAHFWSLAVEEHFYLTLPLLLVALRDRRRTFWFGLLTGISILWSLYLEHRPEGLRLPGRTDMQICWLFISALFALLLRRPAIYKNLARYLQALPVVLFCGIGTFSLALIFHDRLIIVFLLATLPCLVISTVLHPTSWVGRLLELPVLRALGRISYSLYLWQQIFCRSESESSVIGRLQHLPWNIAISLILAVISYYIVERPFIRLGHRLSPPVTAGRDDLPVNPAYVLTKT